MDSFKVVLVVEHNAHGASILQRAANKAPSGLAFHFVGSGEDAISYLQGAGEFANRRAHPLPELVLLDPSLPGVSGLDVLAWIRHHPSLYDLKVFVWTDAGEPEVLDRATLAGANRFMPKSVEFVRGGLAGFVGAISQALKD